MDLVNVSTGFAFIAGVASFLSPCVFALVPAYISYLGGRSVASALGGRANRWLTFTHGVAFVLGFSVVFISLGLASSALGAILYEGRAWLARIGGAIVILFGIHMTGLFRIPFLEYDLRPQTAPDRSRGYVASFLMGIFFSAGWSPCVGPILGVILTLAFSGGSPLQGVGLLAAYSAGLAIPFLIAATQISLVTTVLRRYGKVMRYAEIVMGILMIIVGLMLLSGRFSNLANLGTFLGAYDELVVGRAILIILTALVILGLIPAYLAWRKGRNFVDWWFFGTGLLPVALPMALLLKPRPREVVEATTNWESEDE